jgi:hypothetical protein
MVSVCPKPVTTWSLIKQSLSQHRIRLNHCLINHLSGWAWGWMVGCSNNLFKEVLVLSEQCSMKPIWTKNHSLTLIDWTYAINHLFTFQFRNVAAVRIQPLTSRDRESGEVRAITTCPKWLIDIWWTLYTPGQLQTPYIKLNYLSKTEFTWWQHDDQPVLNPCQSIYLSLYKVLIFLLSGLMLQKYAHINCCMETGAHNCL